MFAACLWGFGSTGNAIGAEQWSVRGGWTQIGFEQAELDTMGLSIKLADAPDVPVNSLRLTIGQAATLDAKITGPIFEGITEGMIVHDGGVLITSIDGGQVLLDGFRIRPAKDAASGFEVVTSRGRDDVVMLTIGAARVGYDQSMRSLLIETADLSPTSELAAALGNPKLVDRPIGGLRTRAELTWVGGDQPEPVKDEPLGGVAGGNNGTNCWNSGDPLIGPDVIVGDIIDVSNYASDGTTEAFALGTTSCNIGSSNLSWQASPDPDHPVIGQNIFRLKNGRFEQIGQSWLKHGFTALTENVCGCGCSGQGGAVLGVGCSDPYCCGLNGSQTGLGAKSDVNAFAGTNLGSHDTSTGVSIYKRLQVKIVDIDSAQNPGAVYFGECQYIAADDAASGNSENNASYRPVTFSGSGTAWSIALSGTTQREQPGIRAWKDTDPTVTETDVKISGEGLVILSAKATDLGTGFYHYEYAVQNLNSDRSIGSFSIPVDSGATVQNIGFHDVDYHSGEPYSGTDWPGTFSAGQVSWATTPFASNPNANAIRWGTMYNFRFDCNRVPTSGQATLGVFKPGAPTTVTGTTVIPTAGPVDCNNNGINDPCDVSCAGVCSGVSGCGQSEDCNGNTVPDECETTDCNNNGIPDDCDIAAGTSNDCNSNTVPDECDTFSTTPITSIRVASGLSQPVYIGAPRGDATRLFIVEQGGQIKILSNGTVLATPYLNLSALISAGGERGLLGMAFDPNFNANGRFYVNYTNTSGNTVIARYNATGGNPAATTADPASAVILKTITQDFANHNAGCLQFGPDDFLYVPMGDGGSANDPNGRAQDGNSLLGKILRLDVNNPPTYVAAGNPYIGAGAPLDEIWAFGMRNPWRFSFDRLTGDMYIGDVGQDAHEELDFEPAGFAGGRNYGWRCMEGAACTGLSGCTCNGPTLTLPILDLAHASNPGICSVIGGYVYRGCAIPDLQGTYFYSDYCANWIRSFRYSPGTGITDAQDRTLQLQPDQGAIASVVSFGEDGVGELYYCSQSNGGVYKIVPDVGPQCGNGVVEAGEECEPPNTATCDANCQLLECVPPSFSDTFETNLGWSPSWAGDDATTGLWTRVNPNGTAAAPEDDHTSTGTLCFVTGQGTVGGAVGEADVDNGRTTLVSPTLDLTGGGTISYWRWYDNDSGALPNTEEFRVDISNNNGTSWVNVETVGPTGPDTTGGWIQHSFDVSTFVTPTNQVRVRFVAEDLVANGGSIVEAGVDDFTVTPTDCNNNCVSDLTDIANSTSEDCNSNGIPDECEGGAQNKTYDITVNPPLAIPDGTATYASTTFNVPDSGVITDLNLGLTLPHTWNGDVAVRLSHEATTVVVIDRPGFPDSNPQFGFDNDGFDVLLDDEGTGGAIETIDSAGGVVSPPGYVPNNPLSAFDGMDKQGLWTLEAADFVGSDSGTITAWSLQFANQGNDPCPPITDCNNNGVDDADDITLGTSQDCNSNTIPDECDIASGTSLDCDGGPVGAASGGAAIFGTFCFGCHNTNGQGGVGFPGPNIRNKSRKQIWTMLLPPTAHPGGAHPEFDMQDFADLEAFLADAGSRGRPDRIPDECQTLSNCDVTGLTDACELEAGTQVDIDYNGVPDDCESCTNNAQCDDGQFCTGVETCNLGTNTCQSGTSPCSPLQICDETNDVCIDVPVLGCSLSSDFAAAGGSVTLELRFDGPVASMRGYEVKIGINRTSGAGSLAPDCPSGLAVDTGRPDFIFAGAESFVGLDCDNLRVATGLATGFPVGASNYYLAHYTLDVSLDATPGSTFEVSILPKPDTFLRDGDENPITYAVDTPCTLTITDCAPPTAIARGSRYIDVTPAADVDPVALRVTGDTKDPNVSCVLGYVQLNGTLGAVPVFQTPAQWGTVHVHDDEIIPSTVYSVQTDCGPIVGSSVSPEIAVTTSRWGDVNHDLTVDIDDILCVLSGFGGNFNFCTAQEVDMWGCVPDGTINIDDILRVLAAFGGAQYPCADPCP